MFFKDQVPKSNRKDKKSKISKYGFVHDVNTYVSDVEYIDKD